MAARNSHVSSAGFNAARSSPVASASASVSAIERQFIVEGWTLGTLAEDAEHEPRIQDIELGTRLRLKDPRQVRKLIKSMMSAKIFNPCAVMHAAEITGGRPATEFWLTEEEALLVAMRSDAQGALLIQREMIRVFMLARRGLLPQQIAFPGEAMALLAQTTSLVAQLANTVAANNQQLQELRLMVEGRSESKGRVNAVEASRILLTLREVATDTVGERRKGDEAQQVRWRAARAVADRKAREAARLPMGRAWCTLDPRDLNAAWRCIDEMREAAKTLADKREAERQRKLFQ